MDATPGRGAPAPSAAGSGRLREVAEFGSNPGNLRMFCYIPERLPQAPPLVVVLHGCKQDASGYDSGAGWSTLADRYGFVVLLPEQQAANNAQTCFNWFEPGDAQRGRGEALSIREMVDHMVRHHRIDGRRVFVTGLSAGGAMTSVMLAAYPDVFAGGAIIAGLPYGSATSVAEALEGMLQGRSRPAGEWGALVRAASPHRGPWPKVSVWHGSADATVKPMNAGEIIKQWTAVHGLPQGPSREEVVDGYPRRVWCDADGAEMIEEYTITGMAHGTPLAIDGGADSFGAAGPFLLDVGIASSYHIARFWGLAPEELKSPEAAMRTEGGLASADSTKAARSRSNERGRAEHADEMSETVRRGGEPARYRLEELQRAVTRALRAAGLIR